MTEQNENHEVFLGFSITGSFVVVLSLYCFNKKLKCLYPATLLVIAEL